MGLYQIRIGPPRIRVSIHGRVIYNLIASMNDFLHAVECHCL